MPLSFRSRSDPARDQTKTGSGPEIVGVIGELKWTRLLIGETKLPASVVKLRPVAMTFRYDRKGRMEEEQRRRAGFEG